MSALLYLPTCLIISLTAKSTSSTASRDVFVHVTVAVQFSVFPDKVYQAYYSLTDATPQITADQSLDDLIANFERE